jgi:hypothetical protein
MFHRFTNITTESTDIEEQPHKSHRLRGKLRDVRQGSRTMSEPIDLIEHNRLAIAESPLDTGCINRKLTLSLLVIDFQTAVLVTLTKIPSALIQTRLFTGMDLDILQWDGDVNGIVELHDDPVLALLRYPIAQSSEDGRAEILIRVELDTHERILSPFTGDLVKIPVLSVLDIETATPNRGLEPRIRRAGRKVYFATLRLLPSGNGRFEHRRSKTVNHRLGIEIADDILDHKVVDAMDATTGVFDIFAIRKHVLLSPPFLH